MTLQPSKQKHRRPSFPQNSKGDAPTYGSEVNVSNKLLKFYSLKWIPNGLSRISSVSLNWQITGATFTHVIRCDRRRNLQLNCALYFNLL